MFVLTDTLCISRKICMSWSRCVKPGAAMMMILLLWLREYVMHKHNDE